MNSFSWPRSGEPQGWSEYTRVQVLKEDGKSVTSDKWMWLTRGGPPGQMAVLFEYDTSRSEEIPLRLLDGFRAPCKPMAMPATTRSAVIIPLIVLAAVIMRGASLSMRARRHLPKRKVARSVKRMWR